MRRLLILSAILFSFVLAAAQEPSANRFRKVVDEMVQAVNKADYDGAGKDFAPSMEEFFPLEKRAPFFKELSVQHGKIEKLGEPRLIQPSQAIFVAQCERGKLDIQVWLDEKGKITGLLFLQHKPDIPVPEKNETELSLPFKGKWLVAWGGDTEELNQHHDVPSQRFAFDFLGADEEGQTYKGDGTVNEDYFAFGREVLAPADGNVTDVVNGIRDNVPGSMNSYFALGNAVFIQHRKYEVSVLAHLKLDSITVKVGDKVKRGQVVGLCGNSGNSSEPHLHYHLQNTPIVQDGTGIKCYFEKMVMMDGINRRTKKNYSPIKGDVVIVD